MGEGGTKLRFKVEGLDKTSLPRLYRLKARGEGEFSLELPLKLLELVPFEEGDSLEVGLSKEEMKDVKDDDLYMRGRVIINESKDKDRELHLSIGGLILELKVPLEKAQALGLDKLAPYDEVYVLVRRLKS